VSGSGVFDDLDAYIAAPRITGLVASPDGTRLACSVQTLSDDRTKYLTALWSIDPNGTEPPRRLTRSVNGESAPAYLPNGDLLFVSKRSDVAGSKPQPREKEAENAKSDDETPPADEVSALWLLPSAGGEAIPVVRAASSIGSVLVARDSGAVFVTRGVLPGDARTDGARRKARREAGVSALLHEASPVRHWDHDLGPDQTRLFALDGSFPDSAAAVQLRDLTPDPGQGLEDVGTAVSADGSQVAIGWRTALGRGQEGRALTLIDVATGATRVLAQSRIDAAEKRDCDEPAFSPDGRFVVCVDERDSDYDRAPTRTLRLFELATGQSRDLTPEFDRWPSAPVFSADSRAVFFGADDGGHHPVFRVDIETGDVVRLTTSGAYSHLCVAPDPTTLFALRSAIDSPPVPVRLAADGPGQQPVVLPAPGAIDQLPGRLIEIEATASDGVPVHSWLVLPDDASATRPAPMCLWVHGGPLMSWHTWNWRWNPWLLAARGYAVLMPNPGLSQGYGDEFVQRAWGKWGPVPFGDLMAAVDAAVARPDIDETATAAMGGSYGGFMANWIAGHTDRFKAIVTHASLWSLEHFTGTTDHPGSWMREWSHPLERRERFELNDPSRHLNAIRTPMLVIHGDLDYRVPIGEGLRLWSDLVHHGVDAKFLYFPDENHWVLKPGNAKVWYQTVLAFLDHHVRGAAWVKPELL